MGDRLEDLGNVYGRARIQSCNACVSTSMALCVWPCNCYEKGDKDEPDLMWDLDLYARLDLADAWAIIGPVNWYGPTSNLKLMFDRLVCMNGGNPREELIDHKDPEKAMALEHSPEWEELSQSTTSKAAPPPSSATATAAATSWTRPAGRRTCATRSGSIPTQEPFDDERDAYAPLVWQCRYSGIEVPDALWRTATRGDGVRVQRQPGRGHGPRSRPFMAAFDAWTRRVRRLRRAERARSSPGQYRAYGYTAPGHRCADLKLKWRELRMKAGRRRRARRREAAGARDRQRSGLGDEGTRGGAAAGARLPPQSFSSVMSGASGFFMPTTW